MEYAILAKTGCCATGSGQTKISMLVCRWLCHICFHIVGDVVRTHTVQRRRVDRRDGFTLVPISKMRPGENT